MIVTHEGASIQFLFTPGHIVDISAFRLFNFKELRGAKIYGDRAYNDSNYEEPLKKGCGINLISKRRNSRAGESTHLWMSAFSSVIEEE